MRRSAADTRSQLYDRLAETDRCMTIWLATIKLTGGFEAESSLLQVRRAIR